MGYVLKGEILVSKLAVEKVDCIILCGGKGTRLRETIGETQKVMADVEGKPFLDILLERFKNQGIRRVILCTGYKSEEVEVYYKNNDFGLEIVISKEEEPLGTGGAIKNAIRYVQSDSFFALNGDCICDADLNAFYTFHQSQGANATLLVSRIKNNKDFGVIVMDEQNNILAFKEKEVLAVALVNVGIYCFKKDIASFMPSEKKFSIEYDGFPRFVGHDFKGFIIDESFLDIGTPDRFEKVKDKTF